MSLFFPEVIREPCGARFTIARNSPIESRKSWPEKHVSYSQIDSCGVVDMQRVVFQSGQAAQVRKRFAFSTIPLQFFSNSRREEREEVQPIGLRNSTPISWTSPASWQRLTLA
jgi:hypothetical protein